jgi:hypothetical protein
MPTTRSTAPVNRSGLQRGTPLEPPKRKRSNADEHAHKRLKDSDEIKSDIREEGGELRVKGGRDGKKVRGKKKRSHLRFVLIPQYLWYSTNYFFTGKQAWTKHGKRQQ